MSLTTVASIFPGFQPGLSFLPPGTPIRSPKWNYKVAARYQNFRQTSVNGVSRVVKYWPNRLRQFEWNYGYLYNDPTGTVGNLGARSSYFVNYPVPATDFAMLDSFYDGMQGGGNLFLFQPPDSVVGGSATINAVYGQGDLWTLYFTTSPYFTLGLYAAISGLSTATWLNGQTLQILAMTPNSITVYFVHANLAKTTDSGTAAVGQLLSPIDANGNTQLVKQIGSYPNLPLSGSPYSMTQRTESVQVIDSSTLVVYANGSNAGGTYTLEEVNSIAPYQGLVLAFGDTPATPLIASFTSYYPCRFTEDTQEYENFLTMLYAASSVKFDQQVVV